MVKHWIVVLLLLLMVKPRCFCQVVKLWGIVSTWWLNFDSFLDWCFELLSNGLVANFAWWLSFDACFGLLEEDWESQSWSKISRSFCFAGCISGMFNYILSFQIFHFLWCWCIVFSKLEVFSTPSSLWGVLEIKLV